MKKSFLTAILFLSAAISAEQNNQELIQKAQFIEKYQVYVLNDLDHQIVWYKNKVKKAEGTLKNHLREGYWRFWYENGALKAEGNFVKNKMNGYWKYYYSNGQLQSEGNYQENKKQGEWKFYYPTGQLKSVGNFVGGLRNGEWIEYYENGKIFFKGFYKNDLANGFWQYYFNDGSFYQAGNFENDVRVGAWKICIHPNGICGTEINDNKSPPPLSNLPKVDVGENQFSTDINNPAKILESFEKEK